MRLVKICRIRPGITLQKRRHIAVYERGDFDVFDSRFFGEHFDSAFDEFSQIEINFFKMKMSGFDFREI